MREGTTEISVKGKWVKVPSLEIGDNRVIIQGRWIKLASIHDEWWLEKELTEPRAYIQALQEQVTARLRADVFTFTQKMPGSQPKFPYPMEWESVAAAKTANFKEWWEGLPQETRKNVRRSQKRGVTVAVKEFDDHLVRGIAEVNNESPLRQGARNAHYGKTFDQVKKDHSSFLDRSDFICAYHGDEMIGFIKLVYRGEVAALLNLAVKTSHNDKRPANALIAKAVELCEAKGASFLTYGKFNYGNKRENPLREFKERNGFAEQLTPRYYLPLTGKGALCLKLNLHRGVIGILPHRVITLLVDARSRWYKLRQSS